MLSWQPMVEALLQRLSMTACNMTDLRTLADGLLTLMNWK